VPQPTTLPRVKQIRRNKLGNDLISVTEYTLNSQRSEAFAVAKADKIFLGYQLCQLVKNYCSFKDHLCTHHPDDQDDGARHGH
jgi:hypothetical protein